MLIIDTRDPVAVAAVRMIHEGDAEGLRALLAEQPALARAHLGTGPSDGDAGMTRTLLHVLTDWPAHFANGPQTASVLIEAGADMNARFTGPHSETPLHWAASSDDIGVLDALLYAGADIEVDGAVIAGGTPMADATAFGQWKAAARLSVRGAETNLWQASVLGLVERVIVELAAEPAPGTELITEASGEPAMAASGAPASCCSTTAPTVTGSDGTT